MRARDRAGRSAAQVYEAQRRAWITRNRRAFHMVDGVTVLIVLGCAALRIVLPSFDWYLGVIAGGAICLDLALRLNPPPWIGQWQMGSFGEQRTARALEDLPPGWHVVHDLARPGRSGNLDHVVVGPNGVFLLDSKNPSGECRVDGDTLVVMRPGGAPGYRDDRACPGARIAAAELHDRLGPLGVRWVYAAIVVWADMPTPRSYGRNIAWLSGSEVVGWMTSVQESRTALSQDRVRRIHDALREMPKAGASTTGWRGWHRRRREVAVTG